MQKTYPRVLVYHILFNRHLIPSRSFNLRGLAEEEKRERKRRCSSTIGLGAQESGFDSVLPFRVLNAIPPRLWRCKYSTVPVPAQKIGATGNPDQSDRKSHQSGWRISGRRNRLYAVRSTTLPSELRGELMQWIPFTVSSHAHPAWLTRFSGHTRSN